MWISRAVCARQLSISCEAVVEDGCRAGARCIVKGWHQGYREDRCKNEVGGEPPALWSGTSGGDPSTRFRISWCGSIWRRFLPRSKLRPVQPCRNLLTACRRIEPKKASIRHPVSATTLRSTRYRTLPQSTAGWICFKAAPANLPFNSRLHAVILGPRSSAHMKRKS